MRYKSKEFAISRASDIVGVSLWTIGIITGYLGDFLSPSIPLGFLVLASIWLLLNGQLKPLTVTSLLVVILILIWQGLCGYVNEVQGLNGMFILFLIGTCAAYCLATFGEEFFFRTFFLAGIIVIMIGWALFVVGVRPPSPKSGYSWNLLHYRMEGLMGAPNSLGFLCFLTLAIGLKVNSNLKLLAIPIVTMIATESRTAFLATLVYFFCYVLVLQQSRSNALRVSAIVSLAAGLRYFGGSSRSGSSDTLTGRGMIWNYCRSLIQLNRPFGFGPLTVERFVGGSTLLTRDSNFNFFHCHNQFYDDRLNFGTVGLVLTAVLLVRLGFRSLNRGNRNMFPLVMGLVAFCFYETPLKLFGHREVLWHVMIIFGLFFLQDFQYRKETYGQKALEKSHDIAIV